MLFKPEDFDFFFEAKMLTFTRQDMADITNRILTERGVRFFKHEEAGWIDSTPTSVRRITHQALLVCIEELPKAECEHKFIDRITRDEGACKQCGIKLRAKWEPA